MVDELQPDRTVRPVQPPTANSSVRPVHTTVPGRTLSDDHDRDPVLRPAVKPAQQRSPRDRRQRPRKGLIDDYA
ncbi:MULTISPECIES: hypothetical protein [unclassified Thioalkalivibrio]|uniref:hypothetical protein n=1 Tax=unclassified Thioalkalivibrio TaxID=2621013 RepID=UPI0009DA53F9|nr:MULTISPECIES: hypothetical protein [unclassified Thioalkalivibrio]